MAMLHGAGRQQVKIILSASTSWGSELQRAKAQTQPPAFLKAFSVRIEMVLHDTGLGTAPWL